MKIERTFFIYMADEPRESVIALLGLYPSKNDRKTLDECGALYSAFFKMPAGDPRVELIMNWLRDRQFQRCPSVGHKPPRSGAFSIEDRVVGFSKEEVENAPFVFPGDGGFMYWQKGESYRNTAGNIVAKNAGHIPMRHLTMMICGNDDEDCQCCFSEAAVNAMRDAGVTDREFQPVLMVEGGETKHAGFYEIVPTMEAVGRTARAQINLKGAEREELKRVQHLKVVRLMHPRGGQLTVCYSQRIRQVVSVLAGAKRLKWFPIFFPDQASDFDWHWNTEDEA